MTQVVTPQVQRAFRIACGSLLAVPQFTLVADTKKGSRPSFSSSASPEQGMRLFGRFVEHARRTVRVETGRFGAHMRVRLVNDGPVIFWLQARRVI